MNIHGFWDIAEESSCISLFSPVVDSFLQGRTAWAGCLLQFLSRDKWKHKLDIRTRISLKWILTFTKLIREIHGGLPTGTSVLLASHWKNITRQNHKTALCHSALRKSDFFFFLQQTHPWTRASDLVAERRLHHVRLTSGYVHFWLKERIASISSAHKATVMIAY